MQIEKTVYFVRHGESEHNAAPIFQAPTAPLSAKGKLQAQAIAQRAANISFETLIASPYLRAKETAEAIAQATGKEPEYSELFVERIKPASIDGKPYTDEVAAATWHAWEKSLYTPGMHVEDGENFDDLIERTDKALAFLSERPEETLMVVTHGYFLRALVARVILGEMLTRDAFKRFQLVSSLENTGLAVMRHHAGFQRPASWNLWIYNDHAHL